MQITYSKCGDYYIPDLVYSVPDAPIGKYDLLRESYLKEHHSARYNHLLMTGKLCPHLIDVDEQAQQLLDTMIPRLMAQQGEQQKLLLESKYLVVKKICLFGVSFLLSSNL